MTGGAGPSRVIYSDLQKVANDLWAAGAEAIAINGQRLTATSTIRSAGAAILVDFRPVTSPYEVSAIGPGSLREQFDDSRTAYLMRRVARDDRVVVRGACGGRPDAAGRSGAAAALRGAVGQPESVAVGFGCRRFDRSRAVRPGRPPAPPEVSDDRGAGAGRRRGAGDLLDPTVPAALQPYLPIAVVAALDAVFGGVRAKLDRIFDDKQFVMSFISNVLVAALIVYLGDQLGVGGQLSTGVVVVLGVRIFGNVAAIRRHLFRA